MIAAFIVLLVVALAFGGYIAFDVFKDKKRVPPNVSPAPAAIENEQIANAEHKHEPEVEISSPAPAPEPKSEVAIIAPEACAAVDAPVKPKFIVIKYSRSFLSKLIQSSDEVKGYYSELKNKLLSYDKVKSKIAWKCETFRAGRKTVAKLRMRGKTLSIYLALDPEVFNGTKYRVQNLSDVKSNRLTPCAYKIKTERRLRYAEELIEQLGLAEKPIEYIDYAKQLPYEDDDALIQKRLIKVLANKTSGGTAFKPSDIRESVSAHEVDSLMQDEVAATLIEKADGASDRTKTGIVNIDTLAKYFESGEVVTLDEIKKRVNNFNKQITYIKVLARGTLGKQLTVVADSFSIQAVKMIILTGGKAIKGNRE